MRFARMGSSDALLIQLIAERARRDGVEEELTVFDWQNYVRAAHSAVPLDLWWLSVSDWLTFRTKLTEIAKSVDPETMRVSEDFQPDYALKESERV